jgi:hypothetical protein
MMDARVSKHMKSRCLALIILLAGCGLSHKPSERATLSHCDRLEIWKAVHVASAFAKQASTVIKYETGRDDYDRIYLERLTPTLRRYGIDRSRAVLIFEEEGGWPYDSN